MVNSTSKSVEELWTFKSSVNKGLSRFVPCKMIGSKKSLPWITQSIKRLIRKRDSLYQKHKRSSRLKDRKHFITTRHMVKAKIKQAYDRYLEDLLGISKPDLNTSPTGEAGQSKFEVKKLFSFLKTHARIPKVLVLFATHIPIQSTHQTLTKQTLSTTTYSPFSPQSHPWD